MKKAVALLVLFVLPSCGTRDLSKIKKLEHKGKYYEAWQKFQEFAATRPEHPQAPEALFRAGLIGQFRLNDCYMAGTFYDRVIERYPQADPWARAAAYQKNNCPDYFPLIAGAQWVEGDSETKGRNARIEVVARNSEEKTAKNLPSELGVLERTFYAGETKFKTTKTHYRKSESELLENSEGDPVSKVIMKWPIATGTSWTTKSGGKLFRCGIAATDKKISVQAGEFNDCVQVVSTVDGGSGSTNDYYAPGVGKILTTISTGGQERRNTELLSYKSVEWPDLNLEEKKK